MATFLYRLGRFSFRRRRLVLMLWIVVLAAIGIGSVSVDSKSSDAFTLPGTQSQRAIDLLQKEFPQASAGGAAARVVFEAPSGEKLTSAANKSQIEALVAELRTAPQVSSVSDPFQSRQVSKDSTIAFAGVTYKVAQADVSDAAHEALNKIAEEGEKSGLDVSLGGNAVKAKEASKAAELIGLAVAAVALVITFGSLLAAGLPLLTAVLGVVAAVFCITIASSIWDVASTASTLALMLGLAVAIDYALFVVSRYRNEIRDGHDPEEAAGRALGTAGSAVVFAGLTVVIALAGLSVIGIQMLTSMGLASAFAVVMAVVIALTLLPALLGFAGMRITKGKLLTRRMKSLERGEGEAWGVRWAKLVTGHPVKALLVSVIGLGLLAIPAMSLRLALPDDSMKAPDSTQRLAYDTISKGFGPGVNGPLTVVVDARGSDDPRTAAADAATALGKLDDIASVRPAAFNQAGDVAIIGVIPQSSPSSQATKDLVSAIRDQNSALHKETGAELMVTGTTAVNIDVSTKLGQAMVPYLAIVVGLALVLLLLVFRSIVIPLKAALGFLLSVAATLGVLVAVFQWGWLADVFGVSQTGPIVSVLPILLIGVVFGLAMDYEVFLVTRMREEYVHGAEPTQAVIEGFRHSARVVTAAAVIMISVFSGFLLDDTALIKSIGLGLASAVLFDAFVVRMTIIPAVMALIGRRAWSLPKWLDRVMPDVDVEGEKLRHKLEAEKAASTPEDRSVQTARAEAFAAAASGPVVRSSGRSTGESHGGGAVVVSEPAEADTPAAPSTPEPKVRGLRGRIQQRGSSTSAANDGDPASEGSSAGEQRNPRRTGLRKRLYRKN
ncbi:MMPL family transporter [Streptomyces canus]|uniref:MMPL family transporter n=1 Tax=Streptomyces TaxID=1883 RepID=UPI00339FBBBE